MVENKPRLAIVVPCYNEEEVLEMSNRVLVEKMQSYVDEGLVSEDSYILYVNDGSKDKTWEIMQKLHNESNFVNCLKLSRNKGHQNAVMAGLMQARNNCDCCISIDADLQDDVEVIREMIVEYIKGNEIVLGVRNDRSTDSFFKRTTAKMFYSFMNWMGAKTVKDHADFRLMSNIVLQELDNYKEVNLFLRGVVLELGFTRTNVYYQRKERLAGETKYPLSKMLGLAMDGITSFSIKPIRLVRNLGIVVIAITLVLALVALILSIVDQIVNWNYILILSIWFIGGVQLLSLGIIGEYVGKTYIESKRRPRYIVETKLIH